MYYPRQKTSFYILHKIAPIQIEKSEKNCEQRRLIKTTKTFIQSYSSWLALIFDKYHKIN